MAMWEPVSSRKTKRVGSTVGGGFGVAPANRALGVQVGVLGPFEGTDDGKLDVTGHHFDALAIALGHVVRHLESVDFAAHLRAEPAGVEGRDATDRGPFLDEAGPQGIGPHAKRGNNSQPCYDNASILLHG